MDKKLLLFTYYWPPSGGPAVQRWLSLTRELAELGWKIWVVTVDEKYATYQMYDETLELKIHPLVQVVKTKTIEPFGLYKLLFGKKSIPAPGFSNEANPSFIKKVSRFIRGNFFTPDPRKFWKNYAVQAGSKIIENENIDLVITAGPPHSTHFIGKALKQKHDVKWVADFHDLWTDVIYYDLLYHLPIVKKKDLQLEKLILESSDGILTVGEKYKEKLLSKTNKISPSKIAVTRIGYDAHLFGEIHKKQSEEFIISYVGSIAEYYQPEVFFKALSEVIKKCPDEKIMLKFIGVASPMVQNLVNKYGLQHFYHEVKYVPHHQAVAYLHEATVLLLINPVTKDEKMVIPGKIYEYLACRKPIINITRKDSETAALIDAAAAGKTFERNEQPELTQYLFELIDQWKSGKLFNINTTIVQQYSRESIAKDLEKYLLPFLNSK